jgi:O-antigen/teichoic acid export membrane protein
MSALQLTGQSRKLPSPYRKRNDVGRPTVPVNHGDPAMSTPLTGLRAIGSNTGFIIAYQTIGSIIRALYAVLLARKLGPELFGLMNYGLGWYAAFLAVANLQLEYYMGRQIALAPATVSDVLSKTMTLRIFSTSLVFVVAAGSAITSGEDNLLTTVLLIYAVAMAGRSAAMWCTSAFISRETARHAFRIEMVFRVAEVLVGISALLMGFGLIMIALIHALSWWGQASYGYVLVRNHLSVVKFRPRLSEQITLFRNVLPVAIASIAASWLMQGPFVLFKDKTLVASDLGVVALVLQIFVLVSGVPLALSRAALPALSRTVARSDDKDALFLGLVLRAAFPGSAALIIGAAAAGAWVVPLIFGDAYHSAGLHLVYGMMLVLPFGVGTIANQILIAHDRTWQAMSSAVIGAAAMTVLLLFFMPVGGTIAGYFLYIFVCMSAWLIFALALLRRRVAVNWIRCLVKPMLASGLSIGLYYLLVGAIGSWGSLVVAMSVLLIGQWAFDIIDSKERATWSRYLLGKFGRGPSTE